MGETIEKKDWLSAKTQFETLLVNAKINIQAYEAVLFTINKNLMEFPEDKTADPMPEGLKEILPK
jgi:hypothetical protein